MPPLGVLHSLDDADRGEERLALALGEVDDGELLGGVLPQGGRERLVELGLAAGEEGRDEGDEVGVDVVDCVSRNVSAGVRGALERRGEGQLGARGRTLSGWGLEQERLGGREGGFNVRHGAVLARKGREVEWARGREGEGKVGRDDEPRLAVDGRRG